MFWELAENLVHLKKAGKSFEKILTIVRKSIYLVDLAMIFSK